MHTGISLDTFELAGTCTSLFIRAVLLQPLYKKHAQVSFKHAPTIFLSNYKFMPVVYTFDHCA
jgi:hypothetical protein